jgi:hypothetical protein
VPNPRRIALSAVAIAVLIAAVVWATSDAQAKAPEPGNLPTDTAAGDRSATGERAAADARTGALAPADAERDVVRVAVDAGTGEAAPEVVLDVVLRVQVGQQQQRLAPFCDVALHLPATSEADDEVRATGRTDAAGEVTFRLAGAVGRRVQLRSGLGGAGSTTITDEPRQRLELLVPARLVAAGSVVQTGSVAVPFADLLLLHWSHDERDPGRLWRIGRADARGRFEIALFAGGRIGASHRDHGDSPMYLVRPPRKATGTDLPVQSFELLLASMAAPLQGVVVDDQGQPVPFAQVEARSSQRAPTGAELAGPPRRTRCDDDGRFRIDRLAGGTVHWAARARGHGWQTGTDELDGGRVHEVRIQLPVAASLTGRITVAGTDDAVADALVTAGSRGSLAFAAARTDADGRYLLHDLGAGPLPVRVRHDLGSARSRRTLRVGEAATWDVQLAAADGDRDLSGVVVDQQQRPLPGWRVVVRQQGHDPVSRFTDEAGRFEVPVTLREGLDVRAFDPGREVTSFADAMLRDQRVDRPVRLVVDADGHTSVHGRVLDATATGVPATIGCWHYERREYARYTADSDGRFRIARAPVGTIDLTIEHPGHVAHVTGALETVRGLPIDLGTVQLALGGGLYGNVVGPGGTAPPDCTLALVQPGTGRELQASYDGGGYRFTGVAPGTHTLLVRGNGIAGASLPVTIEAGVDLPLDLEVHQGIYRRILVRVPRGGGRRATLALRAADDVRWMATGTIARGGGGDGVATFETWMVAGSYEVVVGTDGGHQARQTVRYAPNGTTELTLRTAPR